jgi:hypothetical protein
MPVNAFCESAGGILFGRAVFFVEHQQAISAALKS